LATLALPCERSARLGTVNEPHVATPPNTSVYLAHGVHVADVNLTFWESSVEVSY